MAQKNNIRSIRFSDELAELINQQVGDTFTRKFESLVTRCVWELPQKEQELKQLEQTINRKRKQLQEMTEQAEKLNKTMNHLSTQMRSLESVMKTEIALWQTGP